MKRFLIGLALAASTTVAQAGELDTTRLSVLQEFMQSYENAVKLNDVKGACYYSGLAKQTLVTLQHLDNNLLPNGGTWEGFYQHMKKQEAKTCGLLQG